MPCLGCGGSKKDRNEPELAQPKPQAPPPPPPQPTEEMSKVLYPKPGELGIVWGDKVICCLETGLPLLEEKTTQTNVEVTSEETQTCCLRCDCDGRGEEPQPAPKPNDNELSCFTSSNQPVPPELVVRSQSEVTITSTPQYFGNVHAMNLKRRTRENMPVNQVRVHHLNKGENKEMLLFRLEKGWVMRFLLGPSLHSMTVRLFCNHPPDCQTPFDRYTYHELEWRCPTGMRSDLTDVYAEIPMVCSGSFNYYYTIDESTAVSNANGQGYFLVDPVLNVGRTESISMGCLQVQTVITKLLGPFPEWESRLAVARETGYNMIHFTPVQELGISNSAYSIRDQLRFSPAYSLDDRVQYTLNDLETLVKKMHMEWRVLSLTDLVFNHTAKDSPWLLEHPECSYNMQNSPHLRPAYIVDAMLRAFSNEVAAGKWQSKDVPAAFNNMQYLESLRSVLQKDVFPTCRISEFFICDVEAVVKDFRRASEENRQVEVFNGELQLLQDPQYRRLKTSVNMNQALCVFNIDREQSSGGRGVSPNVVSREDRLNKCCELLRSHLQALNKKKEQEVMENVTQAINNYVANAKYRFVDMNGPRIGMVSKNESLMSEYFVVPSSHEGSLDKAEEMMEREPLKIMAVNGWCMGDNPLRSFAESDSYVYLRRDLVAWGDSCKLRYGKKPSDCPYLWDRMQKYAETTARIFHAIRLDNCHSTPIHVAEYMLDAARKIRADLYVVAELFTGRDELDNLFMNRLGINSLIREALASHDPHDQGRLVHRYGGIPVGSFAQPRVRPLVPTVAHALFFDQTHDNESPIQKRSVYDLWPTASLICMADCAIGSNRGYDQLIPHHIHVVDESRPYQRWSREPVTNMANIDLSFGISAGRQILNNLHYEMAREGYKEIFVDQLAGDVIAVTRHNPQTHNSVILVCRMCWGQPINPLETISFRTVEVQGVVDEVLFEGRLQETEVGKYERDPTVINGLPNYYLDLRKNIPISQSQFCREENLGEVKMIHFKDFTPSTVVCLRTSLADKSKIAVLEIRKGMGSFGYLMRSYSGNTTFDESWDKSNFRVIVSRLTLCDLNRVQYRVDQEERDDMFGLATYHIPNHGNLCYSGLRGVMSTLGEVRPNNDLGHPLCANLRAGDWLMDYMSERLKTIGNTLHLGEWFELMFCQVKLIPRYLIPCYFDAVVTGAYICLREMALQQFSDFVRDGSTFVQALALGSTQFCGFVRSARLPPLSPNLREPKPRVEINMRTNTVEEAPVSLAAGLPHFAAGIWRNWGRDTFIALRGMLLVTHRFNDARMLILSFAGTLRHGLIPNLLSNGGESSRYNCRDSVWWWLQAIQAFVRFSPKGEDILSDPVIRLFPTDDSPFMGREGPEQPLHAVMQEALNRHVSGIKFRERNAGVSIDENMSDEGFNVEVGVKWPQGYAYGGSVHNCGTWMDKMGSSRKAGNWGRPATPRDGSAVEIVGLSASIVRWLAALSQDKIYPYTGVNITRSDYTEEFISFEKWYAAIKANFEQDFYVSKMPNPANEPNPEQIFRRGIYKDSCFATQLWCNFQLRPNFCVAMVVCPDLFDEDNAWTALETAQEILMGPLGMRTLDPSDWAFNGDYHVTDDGMDPKTAHGHNYHNGPEWVWPMAFFLRAKLYFATKLEKRRKGILRETVDFVDRVLCKHYQELMHSPWKSLPELTNSNGSFCADSCRAQAWSDGCILEVLYDLERIETANRPSIIDFQGHLERYK